MKEKRRCDVSLFLPDLRTAFVIKSILNRF